MPGKIIAAAALLVIGTLLGILSELKSDDKTDNTKKKKNNVIKYISLALMFTALILSFKILIKENKDNSEKDNKHKEEYESTINKLNATIIKSDSLLDSLREVKHNTEAINRQLDKELVTVKTVDSATQELIVKNKEVMASQTLTYQANNRILNPLFPLEIQIEFEISANSPLVNNLRKYIKPREKVSTWGGLEQSCNIPWNDSIIRSFDIYFIEEKLMKLSAITSSIRQFNFGVYSGDVIHRLVEYFYKDSTFYFTLIYSLPTFRTNPYQLSSANIGFSDLEHCYIGLRPHPYISDYKLVFLKLSTSKGLRHSYDVWFSHNRGIIDDCSFVVEDPEFTRVFIQKIKSKQSMIIPKYRKLTMWHY